MTGSLQKFFELSPDPQCLLRQDWGFERVNRAFEHGLGWPEGEVRNRSFFDLLHPDDVARTGVELNRLAQEPSGISFTARVQSGSGSARLLHWTLFADADLVYAVARDLTDVEREREALHIVIESSPTAMVMTNDRGLIVLVNHQAEQVFGYPRQELMGRSVDVLVPGGARPRHPGHRQRFLEAPSAKPMGGGRDLHAQRRDGTEIPVEVGLTPIETGDGTFVLSAITDLSARKEAEAAQDQLIKQLQHALAEIKSLRGLIPICSNCKRVRDDTGYWRSVESYIEANTDADFSHGICPECGPKLYGEFWRSPGESDG